MKGTDHSDTTDIVAGLVTLIGLGLLVGAVGGAFITWLVLR